MMLKFNSFISMFRVAICVAYGLILLTAANIFAETCPVDFNKPTVATSNIQTYAIHNDGTAIAAGPNWNGEGNVAGWSDIIAISAGNMHSVGLKDDGTVIGAGDNSFGQLNFAGWTHIKAVAAGAVHTLGLKYDGTVVATGWNDYGQIDVSGWTDIRAIAAGGWFSLGLKEDGTVLVAGSTLDNGQPNVAGWTNIKAIAAGTQHAIGLKEDGTVVASIYQGGIETWTNITAIAGGRDYTLGLNEAGSVLATGWANITAIAAGETQSVGLRSDGTLIGAGSNRYGQLDITGWANIRQPVCIEPDTIPPYGSISINGNATYTNSNVVTLSLSCHDRTGSGCAEMQFSNDGVAWSTPELYFSTKSWVVPSVDGAVTVFVKYKDYADNWSTPVAASIILDTVAPLTLASPIGGTYSTAQSIVLSCDDGSGTGCSKIYYTTNGTAPTTSSSVYISPITIASSTSLKFLAVDILGNTEGVKSENYTFSNSTATLSVTKAGTGAGSVSSNLVGIACGTDCNEAFITGTVVTLTASPDPGSIFVSWGGNADCSDGVVTMDVAKTCRATFNFPRLTVTKAGTGIGTVTSTPTGISCGADCSENYQADTVVTLTATPDPGSIFVSWGGNADCSDGIVTMDAAKTCRATFNLPRLTITKGGTGTGTVTSSSAGINCGTDCTEDYAAGTVVSLIPAPDAGAFFGGWSGNASCSGIVTMDASKTCRALFIRQNLSISVPSATTGQASNLTSNGVTLNAIVNPKGRATTVYFEWGTTTSYGYFTPVQTIGNGTTDVSVAAVIGGLSSGTIFHYRIVAYNAGGAVFGADQTFITPTSVWAWGSNRSGELGDGTNNNSNIPVQVNSLTDVTAVSVGMAYHTLSLKNDGSVWAWGRNGDGQLGDGTFVNRNIPAQVPGLANIVATAAGSGFSVALKNDGAVWAWGANWTGQLGIGTNNDSYVPVQLSDLSGIIGISAGYQHTLALKNDGTVWAWGANWNGELGMPNYIDSSTVPVQVGGISDVIAVAAGGQFSAVLKNDGTVWTWGSNQYGELGDGTNIDSYIPVQVVALTGIKAISGGWHHLLALKDDGSVWASGQNRYGTLGDGTDIDRNVPVQAVGLTGVTAIATGYYSPIALKNDGTVWGWGRNQDGQVGDGTNIDRNIPVQVLGLAGVKGIGSGGSHSLAIK